MSTTKLERPPLGGPGSGVEAWAAFAAQESIAVPEGATRDEIAAAVGASLGDGTAPDVSALEAGAAADGSTVGGPGGEGPSPSQGIDASALAGLLPGTVSVPGLPGGEITLEQASAFVTPSPAVIPLAPWMIPAAPYRDIVQEAAHPNGTVREWQPGGATYLVVSVLFNCALPPDAGLDPILYTSVVTAHWGDVVVLDKATAKRGLDTGMIRPYSE